MEGVICATYILNRCPTLALLPKKQTSYEAQHDQKPKVDHMHVFGCLAYAHVPSQQWAKINAKGVKRIFISNSLDSKAHKIFHPDTNKVVTFRDVIFDENSIHPMTDFHKHNYANGDIFEGIFVGVMLSSSSITNPNL